MDKYTIDALKAMVGKELDECVAHGIKTHEDLDIVKDLTMVLKNLKSIERHDWEEGTEVEAKKSTDWNKSAPPMPPMVH